MKRFITLFSLVIVIAITTVQAQCCKNAAQAKNCPQSAKCIQATSLTQNKDALKIEAYYFHFTRRCVTCQAVEQVSTDALKELYGNKIVLESINLDEKENKELAKKLGIEGQTLLFVKGDQKVDITNDGFMYARTDPEKLKEKIKATIESLK
jgi:hypothetical protein